MVFDACGCFVPDSGVMRLNPNYIYIVVAALAAIVAFKILKWTMKLAWVVVAIAVGACVFLYLRDGKLPWSP